VGKVKVEPLRKRAVKVSQGWRRKIFSMCGERPDWGGESSREPEKQGGGSTDWGSLSF